MTSPPPGSPAHQQQLVRVENLKLYEETDLAYVLDLPGLAAHYNRAPRSIPKIMVESLTMTEDGSLVAFAIMERWVAEQNQFTYTIFS